jgi:hypothetical protein
MVETDSVAMSERAIKIFARGGDIAIDANPPITRYWAIVKELCFLIKKFMSYLLLFRS